MTPTPGSGHTRFFTRVQGIFLLWIRNKKYDDNENEYKNDKRMRLTGIKILKDSDEGKERKWTRMK